MYLRILLISGVMFVSTIPVLSFADEHNECKYCGEWVPSQKKPEQPHLAGELLVAKDNSLALPGCDPVSFVKVFSANELQKQLAAEEEKELSAGNGQGGEMEAILVTKNIARCHKPLPDFPADTLIEVSLRDRGPGREELTVSMFPSTNLKQLLNSYWYVRIPDKGTVARGAKRPEAHTFWRLQRKGYNGCDEGSGTGAIMCSNANLYEADGKLNAEWRQLISLLDKKQRSSLISIQRNWLSNVYVDCEILNNSDGWNGRWIVAFKNSCRLNAYTVRINEFSEAVNCIKARKPNCLDHINDRPQTVSTIPKPSE